MRPRGKRRWLLLLAAAGLVPGCGAWLVPMAPMRPQRIGPLRGLADDWLREVRRQQQLRPPPPMTGGLAAKKKKETKHDSEIKAKVRAMREKEAAKAAAEEAPRARRRRRQVGMEGLEDTDGSQAPRRRRKVRVEGFDDEGGEPSQPTKGGRNVRVASFDDDEAGQEEQALSEPAALEDPMQGVEEGDGVSRRASADEVEDGGVGVVMTESGVARIGTRELRPGDVLVHEDYGFARFEGVFYLKEAGSATRVLRLLFENCQANIRQEHWHLIGWHSPANRAVKLSKYSTQGFKLWAKRKAKVAESAKSSALELMALYASREETTREPCRPDDPDQVEREVEATFGYTATSGQKQAFDDVMRDMVFRSRPMDRVVLGDVGFGKTEVAVRAMHRAVVNGRQVAILAPTTVLAAQHAARIQARFPWIAIELLRGSMPSKEAKRIKEGLKDGSIQVVIGTTALTGKGVVFQKLGLLVVDEEQRLGVGQKEKLKALAKGADVLTLSATPIPRTLQMALSGIRDLTIIKSPPSARLAVKTVIEPYNDNVVKLAIEREIARGGQAFYVVPRIADIPAHVEKLESLLPPSIVVMVVHGSMERDEVEEALVRFGMGKGHVLVSTTLIENGLDLPNANTIIVSHAHMLGLASLYQLRGRVGRSSRQAYAYLLYPREMDGEGEAGGLPRGEARQRLSALKEFSKLGSGAALAKADLAIRGAGEILGYEQSGEGETIGHELYHRMLSDAIAVVRGAAIEPSARVVLDLPTILGTPFKRPEDVPAEVAEEATSFDQLSSYVKVWRRAYPNGRLPLSAKRYLLGLHLQLACRTLSGVRLYEEEGPRRPANDDEGGRDDNKGPVRYRIVLETQGLQQVHWELIRDKCGGRVSHPFLARPVEFRAAPGKEGASKTSRLVMRLKPGFEGLQVGETVAEVMMLLSKVVAESREALAREIGESRAPKKKP